MPCRLIRNTNHINQYWYISSRTLHKDEWNSNKNLDISVKKINVEMFYGNSACKHVYVRGPNVLSQRWIQQTSLIK